LFFCAGSFSARKRGPACRIIINQVGDPQDTAIERFDQMEPVVGSALPLPRLLDDVLDFFDLVLRTLARVDARDVDDRLLGRVEHVQNVVDIGAGVEEIADVELLQVFVAV
jgi:hypothetical protein